MKTIRTIEQHPLVMMALMVLLVVRQIKKNPEEFKGPQIEIKRLGKT